MSPFSFQVSLPRGTEENQMPKQLSSCSWLSANHGGSALGSSGPTWVISALTVFLLLGGTLQADSDGGPLLPPGGEVAKIDDGRAGCALRARDVFGEFDIGEFDIGISAFRLAPWWPSAEPPFSFIYDGKISATLLPSWQRKAETPPKQDRAWHVTTWLDAKTGLKVTATATVFNDFPAVEWVLRFREHRHKGLTHPGKRPGIGHRLGDQGPTGRGPRSNPR